MSGQNEGTASVRIEVGFVTVEAMCGNIVTQTTEAIVNCTNNAMDLSGQVSQALLAKGGSKIRAVCQKKGKIGGDGVFAASTQETNLMCKYLMHVDIEKPARNLVRSCLKNADRLKLQSIALPAIGTGNRKADPETIIQSLVSGVRDFLYGDEPSHLSLIRFVVFEANIMDIFEREIMQVLCPDILQIKVGVVTVEALLGNIVTEATDAIVNSTNDAMNFTGQVSKALIAKSGKKILEQCKDHGNIGGDGVFATCTDGTALKCKYVIHVDIERPVRNLVKSCLCEADRLKLRSISLPSLGTGERKADPEKIVRGLVAGVQGFLSKEAPLHLRRIRFVIFQPQMMSTFQRAMRLCLVGLPASKKIGKGCTSSKTSGITQAVRQMGCVLPRGALQIRSLDEFWNNIHVMQQIVTHGKRVHHAFITRYSEQEHSVTVYHRTENGAQEQEYIDEITQEIKEMTLYRVPVDVVRSQDDITFKRFLVAGGLRCVLPEGALQVRSVEEFWKNIHLAQRIVTHGIITHHALIERFNAQENSVLVIHRTERGVKIEEYIDKIVNSISELSLYVVPENPKMSPSDRMKVIKKGRTKLAETSYNIFKNNCEHFVNWCLHGSHFSEQIDKFASRIFRRRLSF